jgi:hypothetical protein
MELRKRVQMDCLIMMGCDMSANLVNLVRQELLPLTSFVEYEWHLWNLDELKNKINKYKLVILLGEICDKFEDKLVDYCKIKQWFDVIYSGSAVVYPSRKTCDWIISKTYLYHLSLQNNPIIIPNTLFIHSNNSDSNKHLDQLLHFKPSYQSSGRNHLIGKSKNRSTTQYIKRMLKSGRFVICQPHHDPFKETKRVMIGRSDDPMNREVFKVADDNGIRLDWFRLDTVQINGSEYLNEIEVLDARLYPHEEQKVAECIARNAVRVLNSRVLNATIALNATIRCRCM